jgi:hypothetical protein
MQSPLKHLADGEEYFGLLISYESTDQFLVARFENAEIVIPYDSRTSDHLENLVGQRVSIARLGHEHFVRRLP